MKISKNRTDGPVEKKLVAIDFWGQAEQLCILGSSWISASKWVKNAKNGTNYPIGKKLATIDF